MKLLRIIPSMDPKQGGPCQGIRNAIPELFKLGVKNEVVCFDTSHSEYLGNDSFKIYTIGKKKNPWRYNSRLIPWLKENALNYDVIVVHGLWQYHTYASVKAIMAFRNKNILSPKIYIMPHGMLDPYFQKAKKRRLKALRNEIYWKLFENRVVNRSDGIMFTCEEELLLARKTFPNYQPKKEINVGYGIQPPPSRTADMREAFTKRVPQWNKKPYFLFLSRIHQKKGVDLLIKAYRKLEKEMSPIPQLIIAGPEMHPYGHEMQKLAEGSSNILFAGMLSGEAKWGAFYECQCFVLPSHQENFGIAVVEALACAKPVLISDKVNIWREIEEKNGGIVTKDTEEETYNLLKQWLVKSYDEKNEMSVNALKVYEDYFTIAQAAKQFLKGIKS
ncbi:MAG: glycosyl transferase family 1 [Pseudozobellia sp.]|nr:glycosyl transferase family 1 [Pseudozobellia sp.]